MKIRHTYLSVSEKIKFFKYRKSARWYGQNSFSDFEALIQPGLMQAVRMQSARRFIRKAGWWAVMTRNQRTNVWNAVSAKKFARSISRFVTKWRKWQQSCLENNKKMPIGFLGIISSRTAFFSIVLNMAKYTFWVILIVLESQNGSRHQHRNLLAVARCLEG